MYCSLAEVDQSCLLHVRVQVEPALFHFQSHQLGSPLFVHTVSFSRESSDILIIIFVLIFILSICVLGALLLNISKGFAKGIQFEECTYGTLREEHGLAWGTEVFHEEAHNTERGTGTKSINNWRQQWKVSKSNFLFFMYIYVDTFMLFESIAMYIEKSLLCCGMWPL